MPRFQITTTSQVERQYDIEAADEEQAQKRLRTHLADPEALRDGIVTKLPTERNITPERRAGAIKKLPDTARP